MLLLLLRVLLLRCRRGWSREVERIDCSKTSVHQPTPSQQGVGFFYDVGRKGSLVCRML